MFLDKNLDRRNVTTMGKLTKAVLPALLKKPGRHADGHGLYFRALGENKAYWVFRYALPNGKEREMSLGAYPEVTLVEARDRHAAERVKVRTHKIDPLEEKRLAKEAATSSTPTFGKIADDHLAAHQKTRRNERHRRQWFVALTTYCAPIRDMPVNEVSTADVLRVLQPVWTRAPEIASRLWGRIETVLNAAQALGHIDPDRANPARWRGHLDHLLPNPDNIGERGNHAAMPYADLPAFIAKLKDAHGTAAKALMLTILTAARTSETLDMPWDEVDFDAKLWTVPGPRMKMKREHRVPLSDAALDILRGQFEARRPKQRYVFPGARPGKPLSNMALAMTLRRLGARE
jgi:integrase